MPGHALRDLDAPAIREVVRYPRGAEGVAAYRGFNPRIGSTAADHAPDIHAQHRPVRELGPAQLVNATFDANGLLPTTLAGTSVLIAGQPVSLLYTSASQVAVIAPASLPGSAVVVSYFGALSPPSNTTLLPAIPGLFTADASGRGQGAILNQEESVNSVSNPAAPGSVVSLFCSGCGVTMPPGIDGAVATSQAPLANTLAVMIGGQPAVVMYAGSAPGLINGGVQINARIPFGVTGDAVNVSISVGSSLPPSPPVTLAVH